MRDLSVSFLRADGSPRPWTVFVGENGTCKTTLLRTIALATAGGAFANFLVSEPSPQSFLDRRRLNEKDKVEVDAVFGFSQRYHASRSYSSYLADPHVAPTLNSRVEIAPPGFGVTTSSGYEPIYDAELVSADVSLDPLTTVRFGKDQMHWFAAAYGVGRVLARPTASLSEGVPPRDRLRSLFDVLWFPPGTRFSDQLALTAGEDRARAFAACLRKALVERMHTPRLNHIELRGKGGANSQINLVESHRFGMQVGSDELKLPAVWLSQGYQAVISLVADIIGNVWLEAGEEVALDDMEGIVLVDELDLHLHPTWQTEIVTGLKRTFPRMQFIVTTHSPLVLAGCKADEVWMLKQDEATGDIAAEQSVVSPMLLTASEMFREYFGVARTYASELGDALRRYVELASNPYRSNADEEQVAALRAHLLDNRVDVDYQPVARKSAS